MSGTDRMPGQIVAERKMAVLSDVAEIERIARGIVDANPKQAEAYRGGKATLLGFFVGQIMKQTGGSASPQVVQSVLADLLGTPAGSPALAKQAAAPAPTVPVPSPPAPQAAAPIAAAE